MNCRTYMVLVASALVLGGAAGVAAQKDKPAKADKLAPAKAKAGKGDDPQSPEAAGKKAAAKAKGSDKGAGEAEEAEDEGGMPERKSMRQREFTKVRKDSSLKGDEPLPTPPDTRGKLQRLRDRQVYVHFERLARLDVITEVAAAAGDEHTLDRVDEVRRQELERFRKAMALLRRQDESVVEEALR